MSKHVVVIGAGVGGLSAAIRARLHGHSVTVLEAGSVVGGKAASVSQGGYRFDPGPSIVILTRVYEQLFRDAGRQMGDYLRFRRLDPITRVFFGSDLTFDIPADREACVETVRRLAPGDAENFSNLLQKLDRIAPVIERTVFAHPYDRIWQLADPRLAKMAAEFDLRATYRQLVDRWFGSPVLRAFFYGFPSYSGQTYHSRAFGPLLIPYLMIQEGVFYPEGGVGAIPAAMGRLATELGVDIRLNSKVSAMRSQNGRVVEVEFGDAREKLAPDAVLSNVDRLTTRAWLGIPAGVRPSFSYFTCQWGLRTRLPNVAHHTLLVPDRFEQGFEALYDHQKFPEPPIVYLNETAETDPAAAPSGGGNLFAVVSSPALERDIDWERETPRFRRSVIDRIREAGIDWQENEVEVERIQTPLYFEAAHGNYRGSLYGPSEAQRLFGGLMPLRNWDEEYRNLFYCGGSVQPGAGLPMVTLSGKFAVDAMERRS